MGYIYDNAHRLHAIADTHGGLIVYIRDAAGNVVSETVRKDAYSGDNSGTKVQSLTRGFDELSRLIWVKNDAGRKVVSYTYDANGNVETVKRWGDTTNYSSSDDTNRTTIYGYDALNRLSKVTDPLAGETDYAHDALDHITSVIDANELPTTYAVNGLDEITELVSRDSGTTTFTSYDAAGNVLTKNHAGVITTYTYDMLNRPLTATVTTPSDSNVVDTSKTITYTWDGDCGNSTFDHGTYVKGHICRVVRGADASTGNVIDYKYDHLGNVLQEKQYPAGTGTGKVALFTTYEYNTAGQMTSATYPGSDKNRVVNYNHPGSGATDRLTSLATTFNAGTITLADQFGYRALGGIEAMRFASTDEADWHFATWHDTDGRFAGTQMSSSDGNTAGLHYVYDAFNNIYGIDMISNDIDVKHSEYFEYDGLQRLTRADGPYGSLNYTYDATGNRTSLTRYKSVNTLTPWYTETYLYEGQTTTADTKDSNQLESVTRTDGASTPTLLRKREFIYDARGNVATDKRDKCHSSNTVPSKKTLNLAHGGSGRFDYVTVTDNGCP